MERRTFLKSAVALFGLPFITTESKSKEIPKQPTVDMMKLSHHYPHAYHQPDDLFTPEEITEAGFVFMPYLTFIHKFDDPRNPIMQSYVGWGNNLDPNDKNYRPMIVRTSMCTPSYIKTYDLDAGRRRGIEGLGDYFSKKDIFKPMIVNYMREQNYHYVHRVLLGASPGTFWQGKFGDRETTFHLYPVFVRGAKIPKIV
jgi:hypothetical protein